MMNERKVKVISYEMVNLFDVDSISSSECGS